MMQIFYCQNATFLNCVLEAGRENSKPNVFTNGAFYQYSSCLYFVFGQITRPRYSSPYTWPLNHILAYQKQWEVRRKMNAIGWGGKNLEQVRICVKKLFDNIWFIVFVALNYCFACVCVRAQMNVFYCQVYEDVSQCCQALSQRLGTQPYFFNKQ